MILDELTVRADDCKVLRSKYPYSHVDNKKIAEYILSCGDKQKYQTNVKAQMTSWDITSPEIEKIKKWVLKNLISMKPANPLAAFDFSCVWGNVMRKNDYAVPHDHTPAYMSFVYYVKTSEDSSPLCFLASGLTIRPDEGTLVLFPAHLKHFVPRQKFLDERISLAGNIIIN
jgi:hypothetical protein